MKATILKISFLAAAVFAMASCGSASPYTPSSGNNVPAGTRSFLVTPAADFSYWDINGGSNPTLTFQRGQTYTFTVNAPGHPFYIMTVMGSTDTINAYTNGVSGAGSTTVTFTVPQTAPSTLFYDCTVHSAMTGTINITD